jgi:hypothetical protein
LGFVVADHLDGIGDEVFGGEPLFDVIGGDPSGQVAKKNGKAHSGWFFNSVVGFADFKRKGSDPVQFDDIKRQTRLANQAKNFKPQAQKATPWSRRRHRKTPVSSAGSTVEGSGAKESASPVAKLPRPAGRSNLPIA